MIFALWAACQVPATPPKPEATDEQPTCALDPATSPTLTRDLGCAADWDLMAGPASDRWAPGATSVITVIDREDGDTLYFADTQRFPDAWAFVSSTIGRDDRVDQATFLRDNSTRTDRRWILGALTRYPNVDLWLWEPAPYDTADAAMIELAFRAVVAHTWIGRNVRLHLTSDRLEAMDLPDDIETTRTRTLRLLAPWMVLTEGSTIGRLHRDTAESVPLDPAPRELLVIDRLPERLSPRSGTIVTTATPPLGPANLLARAEGAPLVWVAEPGDLAAEGAWAQLDVLPLGWSVQPRTEPEADAWWHDSEPAPRAVPRFLRDVTGVLDLGRLLPADAPLGDALRDA
ncbi:MAG TPA: hypothetical protein PKA64_24825, partial [Myxococcota bacterium]|nr:hypothetical protein [Myxococcota bacterium]